MGLLLEEFNECKNDDSDGNLELYKCFNVKVMAIGYDDSDEYLIVNPGEESDVLIYIWLNTNVDISETIRTNKNSIVIIDRDNNYSKENLNKILKHDNCKFVIDVSDNATNFKDIINNKLIFSLYLRDAYDNCFDFCHKKYIQKFFESYDFIIVSAVYQDFIFE